MRWRHVKVFKQKRLAAKAVMKNYNEINSTRFEYFKERAEETKKLIRKDRSKLWALRGVKLFKSNRSREFWQWLKNSRTGSIKLDQVSLRERYFILTPPLQITTYRIFKSERSYSEGVER